jgi:hypothetical protein
MSVNALLALSTEMYANDEHSPKALSSMLVTVEGISTTFMSLLP